MAPLGAITEPVAARDALARARLRASLVPDLLVEARRIVSTVISGWHGRRKRGIGENFWQYRPYVEGEAMSRIDWRRSARDDHTYVRDNEWEAAHTVWLWADPSSSMLFKSSLAPVSKESRALVLALALAELLARSGERIHVGGGHNHALAQLAGGAGEQQAVGEVGVDDEDEAAARNLGEHVVDMLLADLVEDSRPGGRRGDAVDRDVMPGKLLAERLRQRDDARLGG